MIPGLVDSSDTFVINGKNSPAFYLVDRQFDIWILNTRGTKYGKKHANFSINDRRYWNFTY